MRWGRQVPDCVPVGITMQGARTLVELSVVPSTAWLASSTMPRSSVAAAARTAGARLAARPPRNGVAPPLVRTAVPGAGAGCAFTEDEDIIAGAATDTRREKCSSADDISNGATEGTTSCPSASVPSAANFPGGNDNFSTNNNLSTIVPFSFPEAANKIVNNEPRVPK